MNHLRLWFEITVAGFPFLAAAYFLFLCIFGIYDLRCINPPPEYLPYIGVLVTVLSYVFGLSAHLILQRAYSIVTKREYDAKKDWNFMKNAADLAYRHHAFMYSTLILFRLLAIGTISLGITLTVWIRSTECSEKWSAVALSCLLLTLLFVIAYFSHRKNYIAFRDAGTE
jgi:hypothetical protein